MTNADSMKWRPVIDVVKYNPETVAEITKSLGHEPNGAELRFMETHMGLVPDEITHAEGNALTTAGRTRVTQLITGASTVHFDVNLGVIGVGNSTTAFAAAQVDLQGASKYFRKVDATPATGTPGQITAAATYTSAEANFAWDEWGFVIANSAPANGATIPAGVLLNRKVEALGTKVSGAVWTLQATVTIT